MRQSSASTTPSAAAATARQQSPRNPRLPRSYSENSTASIPDSCFWTNDFLLGAGMVIIQPSSGKVVLVNDTARATWFLPRGRKDVGETLEQCALREAYEESGYRVEFMPLHLPTRAPVPPGRPRHDLSDIEPVFVTTSDFGPYRRHHGQVVDSGGQYFTFYYVGQIPADAVREESTGMPDEKNYVGTLLELEEALPRLSGFEAHIMEIAYLYWLRTLEIEEMRRNGEAERHHHSRRRRRTCLIPTPFGNSD